LQAVLLLLLLLLGLPSQSVSETFSGLQEAWLLLMLVWPHRVLLLGSKLLAGCLPGAVPFEEQAIAVQMWHASANQQLVGSLGSHTPWQRV
jgi:hypothetical protein